MEETRKAIYVSQRMDVFLSQVGDTPKLATALLEALARHIDRKTGSLRRRIKTFEAKWQMNFEEFSEYVRTGRLKRKTSPRDVEGDLKAWEQAVALLKHYTSLKTR